MRKSCHATVQRVCWPPSWRGRQLFTIAWNYQSGRLEPSPDSIEPTGAGPNASQFSVSYPQILSLVSLELSAATPSDGGSINIVLMPDDGESPALYDHF